MSYLIKEMCEEERPRERFKKYGAESLSNEELLSILMRTGTKAKSVRELSFDLLKTIKINDFNKLNYKYLKSIKGVGEVKAMTIICAIEFGKRVLNNKKIIKIRDSDDIFDLVKEDLCYEIQEKFMAIFLDTRKNVLDKKIIFVGSVNGGNVVPRDAFREAVRCNASSMIILHNHPGGSLKPSNDDIFLTKEFIKLGRMMEIPITDHIIVTNAGYYSIRLNFPDLFIAI